MLDIGSQMSTRSAIDGRRPSSSSSRVGLIDARLQGCPLSTILRDASFLRNAESHVNAHAASAPVKSIDIFLSHSWATGGFWKQISLFICCGSPATYAVMLISSLLGAYLFCSAELCQLRFEIIVLLFGFVSFLLALIIIPLYKHRNTMVFLDKCCIPQNDPIAKSYGISRLADYLHVSNKLLILWSPDYLDRLWCVYELAVFLRTHKKEDVILVNMNHLKLCVSLMLLQWLGILTQRLERCIFDSDELNMLSGYALGLASAFSIGLGAFRCGEDWQKSCSGVKSFSVRRSKCSSSADHNTLKQRITGMYGSEARFAEVVRGLWLGEGSEDQIPSWLFCRSSLRLICAPYTILAVATTLYSMLNIGRHIMPLIPLQPTVVPGFSNASCLPGTPSSSPPHYSVPSHVLARLWTFRSSIIPHMMMALRAPSMLLVGHKLATSWEPNGSGRWCLRITFAMCFAAYSALTNTICGSRLLDHPLYPCQLGGPLDEAFLWLSGCIALFVVSVLLLRFYTYQPVK